MIFTISPHRAGQLACKAKHAISNLDRGVRMTGKIYHAVKEHIPEGKIKKTAEKGLSNYESIREKVRSGMDYP